MLSPFPGMDPFLEEPFKWSSVHNRLINTLSNQLADMVSPNFHVEIEERVYIINTDSFQHQTIVPDVYFIHGNQPQLTMVAAKEITIPVHIEPIHDEIVHVPYLEIRDSRNQQVITTIELLSPFNKTRNTKGQRDFLKKRKQVMSSSVHWLEIDLLRQGERPRDFVNRSDYYALLKRGGPLALFEVWYFDLRDGLPTIAVPLTPNYPDVPLDLQAAFNEMYRRAHYAASLDYSAPVPLPSLRPADGVWLKNQIKAWLAQVG